MIHAHLLDTVEFTQTGPGKNNWRENERRRGTLLKKRKESQPLDCYMVDMEFLRRSGTRIGRKTVHHGRLEEASPSPPKLGDLQLLQNQVPAQALVLALYKVTPSRLVHS
jgi:hypothetical protein